MECLLPEVLSDKVSWVPRMPYPCLLRKRLTACARRFANDALVLMSRVWYYSFFIFYDIKEG